MHDHVQDRILTPKRKTQFPEMKRHEVSLNAERDENKRFPHIICASRFEMEEQGVCAFHVSPATAH